jgi:DNA helicase II / ATP-dependent DNA helicase PcrA
MFQVTDEDIQYAEQILFDKQGVFDQERIDFIKQVETCDLQAVPGSGKTTVLLAKLLLLEKYLPFTGGRGIVVLSHTNNAVNEIKSKIAAHCPKLFSEPNFVGTIQSFVDRYLAVPYYTNVYKKQPVRIDDELYNEKATGYMNVWLSGFGRQDSKNAKYYLKANSRFKVVEQLRVSRVGDECVLTNKYMGKKVNPNKPRASTDWTTGEKQNVYNWLYRYKEKMMTDGYLCFDDAYFFAGEYFLKYPQIKSIISKKFQFAFVDEMQDMDKKQYEILEELFWNNGDSTTIFQRIGDKNQAIFTDQSEMDEVWVDRSALLKITGSHRLGSRNAQIVQSLALQHITVTGLGVNKDGSAIDMLPRLYVYDNNSKEKVIEAFAKTIKEFQNEGKIPFAPVYPFKAICWTTNQEPGKIRINDYHPPFSKEVQRIKINYPCLESYLCCNAKSESGFEQIRKNILNGLMRILRYEDVVDDEKRTFTKRRFISYLSLHRPNEFKYLQVQLLKWCKSIFRGERANVLDELRIYIPDLLKLFEKSVTNSKDFIHNPAPMDGGAVNQLSEASNMTEFEGVPIEVTTVHSSKGQTHTATLYLESFYERNVGGGSYESERLAPFIKGASLPADAHKFVKQSMKMAYVGFSRPTHLLGFAIHKDRFDASLSDIDTDSWEVVKL